jgi:hypothetical protein
MRLQVRELHWRQAKGDFLREARLVTSKLFVEPSGRYTIQARKVCIDNDFLSANRMDLLTQRLKRNREIRRLVPWRPMHGTFTFAIV